MAEAAVNLDSLSPAQQEALQQYTAVTDQDVQAAIDVLQRCQWNVQIAITRFFDGEPADPIATATPAVPPPHNSRRQGVLLDDIPVRRSGSRSRGLEPAPRVVPQPESQINYQAPLLVYILLFPLNLATGVLGRLGRAIGYIFPFLPRLWTTIFARNTARGSRSNTSGRRALNPRDTAARNIREFEEEYGPHSLPIFENGYAQAYDLAKRDLKFLLVVLFSPEHDDTSSFIRDTLLAPPVADYIRDPTNNIILWLGNVLDSEAYQVASELRVTKLPVATLMVHTPSVSSTAFTVIARIAGPMPPATFGAKLRSAVSQNIEPLERVRASRAEQSATRSLREQQNTAYERSLAQDRERARKKREEEENRKREEEEAAEREAQQQRYEEDLAQWRMWRAQRLKPEPSADVKDAVRINIRMPSGERVMRKFEADAQLEELYAFVECYDVITTGVNESEKIEQPQGFSFEYGFLLVSPMPREEYKLVDGGTLKERIGRSGTLIVETIGGVDSEEEEDEDDEEE
ncbi:hypothetical protein EJ05DRAFT_477055 [Pseudovirgaria hyperparasitica]|uniref:UBX domain-containing protein n=1 Tax=Pseudovirgaria hyperparasitica TaxID=470096 RepID=A0A6A6W4I2_9PEZI|nr:uncharacterized protein EJ05DRAFT_477055 [Pseudovirgaria hyperparasitica]KAF2756820.1 hypothetical protein EJ05DRAFT_477055 [Pseudovirgaria hyperparasitica]